MSNKQANLAVAERASGKKLVWLQVQDALVQPFPTGSEGLAAFWESCYRLGDSVGRATRLFNYTLLLSSLFDHPVAY